MRLFSLFAIFLGVSTVCNAWEPYAKRDRDISGKSPYTITRLIPSTNIPHIKYVAFFSSAPSFSEGYSVFVTRDNLFEDRRREVVVVDRTPALLIPNKKQNSVAWRDVVRQAPATDRKPLGDKRLAVIRALWINVILDAKYPRYRWLGADGETYYFGSFSPNLAWIGGKIWSPEKEAPPRWITEAGELLKGYVEADTEAEERKIFDRIRERKARLYKYLRRNR